LQENPLSSKIQLIVGLGNPGAEYEKTRHNAGIWFVESLLQQHSTAQLHLEKKFKGWTCKTELFNQTCHILIPTTYMNLSGEAVCAIATFYKIPPEAILIAHDDLDLPVGTIKLKQDGGHGGHNGLRNIMGMLHSKAFVRLRIGIGHPGNQQKVIGHVLNRAQKDEQIEIERSIDQAIDVMPDAINGELEKAMHQLHTNNTE